MSFRDYLGSKIFSLISPYIKEEKQMEIKEKEKYLLQEKYLWYKGNENLIAKFYQNMCSDENLDVRKEYYYSYVGNEKVRAVHSGLPKLLCQTNARLIFGKGADVKANKGDKEDEKSNQILGIIKDENKITKKMKEMIENETWGGKVAYKISYDENVSESPIIEVYDALSYVAIRKLGILQEIRFSDWLDDEYELLDIRKKGSIEYKLLRHKDGKVSELPLDTLAETTELEPKYFDKDILLGDELVGNSMFEGLISEFDALDEAWSQYFDEIRLARSEVYVPENKLSNKTWSKFRKNYAVLNADMSETAKNEIEHIQADIRSDEYKKAVASITSNILVMAGFSPFTVGIDDEVGANASGESLTKREIASLRTRQAELPQWEEFFEAMFYKLLFAYALLNKKFFDEDVEIIVSFGEYISPDRNEKIQQAISLKESGIIDNEQAINEIYDEELNEEEKQRILINTGDYTDTEEIEE